MDEAYQWREALLRKLIFGALVGYIQIKAVEAVGTGIGKGVRNVEK